MKTKKFLSVLSAAAVFGSVLTAGVSVSAADYTGSVTTDKGWYVETVSSRGDYFASDMFDGDTTTRWCTESDNDTITINFGSQTSFDTIEMYNGSDDYLVLCQDNGHIKPLFFSKISKMHKLVAFIPRFA